MNDKSGDAWPGWERVVEGSQVYFRLDRSLALLDGIPYFEYPPRIARLKREGRLEEAAELLRRLVVVVEVEADQSAFGLQWKLAPWYYEQLAIVYRKLKQFSNEVAIVERYLVHPQAVKERLPDFQRRLAKAVVLQARAGGSQPMEEEIAS